MGARHLAAAALAVFMTSGGAAVANEEAYEAAEEAIRAFRDDTFLLTPCERAFSRFWRAYRAGKERALVFEITPFGAREYFGRGNPASEPLLVTARDVCSDQIGRPAGMVLRVLRDRERQKEKRVERIRHAERFVSP